MSTINEILVLAGVSLYGPRWTADLARELGISDRHMRRLAAGTASPSPGILRDVLVLLDKREKALRSIAVQLAYAMDAVERQRRLDA